MVVRGRCVWGRWGLGFVGRARAVGREVGGGVRGHGEGRRGVVVVGGIGEGETRPLVGGGPGAAIA